MKMSILFWVMTPCRFIGRYQNFGEKCCLHLSAEDFKRVAVHLEVHTASQPIRNCCLRNNEIIVSNERDVSHTKSAIPCWPTWKFEHLAEWSFIPNNFLRFITSELFQGRFRQLESVQWWKVFISFKHYYKYPIFIPCVQVDWYFQLGGSWIISRIRVVLSLWLNATAVNVGSAERFRLTSEPCRQWITWKRLG